MSSWPERVLLACYEFPPSAGIGGRRWAKLAKGLAARGTEVHVLAAEPAPDRADSQWASDVDDERIRVHRLPRVYPRAITHPRRTLVGRVAYRLALRRLRRLTDGTPYDTALGWDDYVLPAAARLLASMPFDALLATGAPFHLLYLCTRLKQEHPDLPFLADFRDPWVGAANYGMQSLDEQRLAAEVAKQRTVFTHADIVTATGEHMLADIRDAVTTDQTWPCRFEVIPHFFDPDDHGDAAPASPAEPDLIRLVYGGALYLGLEGMWPGVFAALDDLEREHPGVYARIRIEVYTDSTGMEPDVGRHAPQLTFQRAIGRAILDRIRTSSAALMFVANQNRDYLTTKFFEYTPCRKPFVVMGPAGHVGRFVEDNGLGVAVRDPATELAGALVALAEGKLRFDPASDIDAYALPAAVEKLVAMLRNVRRGPQEGKQG